MSDERKYSIQFVSKLTGLNAHTIRAWEKRYQAIVPERNESGKRVFNKLEVDRLHLLAKLVNLGNTISDIADLPMEKLQDLATEYSESQGAQLNQSYHQGSNKSEGMGLSQIEIDFSLKALISGINNYKLDIISHELEKLKKALGPKDFALRILSPLLVEVGHLVYQGRISIAQEHSLSAILRFHIGHMLFSHYQEKNLNDEKIIFATPEGEMHEFGIMMGALICAYHKHNFIYLGTNMPKEALVEACNQIKGRVLVLGVTHFYEENSGLNLTKYIDHLAENLSDDIEFWVGGGNPKISFSSQERVKLIPSLEKLDELFSQRRK